MARPRSFDVDWYVGFLSGSCQTVYIFRKTFVLKYNFSGAHWFHNRKLIAPAFNFSILEDFTEVMIDKAAILNSRIESEIKIHGDKPFDIFVLCLRCALDIICGNFVESHSFTQLIH